MKWLVALVALTAVGAAVVATKVVLDNRDPVPADTLACVRKAGLAPVRSSDALAGTLRVTRRWDWGRTSGALIRGTGDDWAVLALWNADTPSPLTTRGLGRVFERPSAFPLVAVESPDAGALQNCATRN